MPCKRMDLLSSAKDEVTDGHMYNDGPRAAVFGYTRGMGYESWCHRFSCPPEGWHGACKAPEVSEIAMRK